MRERRKLVPTARWAQLEQGYPAEGPAGACPGQRWTVERGVVGLAAFLSLSPAGMGPAHMPSLGKVWPGPWSGCLQEGALELAGISVQP